MVEYIFFYESYGRSIALPVVVETDTAVGLGKAKAKALPVATSTSTAMAFGRKKTRALPVATEVDVAVAFGGGTTPVVALTPAARDTALLTPSTEDVFS